MAQDCLGYIYTIKYLHEAFYLSKRDAHAPLRPPGPLQLTPKYSWAHAIKCRGELPVAVSAVSSCNIPFRCSPFKVNQILWNFVVCPSQIREDTSTFWTLGLACIPLYVYLRFRFLVWWCVFSFFLRILQFSNIPWNFLRCSFACCLQRLLRRCRLWRIFLIDRFLLWAVRFTFSID